jgi:hypothetical protein
MADNDRKILATGEVAKLLKQDPQWVTKRARQGRIPAFRTPAGNYRFYEDEILPLVPKDNDGDHLA